MLDVPAHLQPYVDYLNNVGKYPSPAAWFDDDWEPIGPTVRKQLSEAGLAETEDGQVFLVWALRTHK